MIEDIWIPAAMPVVTDWTLPFNAAHISCRYSPGHAHLRNYQLEIVFVLCGRHCSLPSVTLSRFRFDGHYRAEVGAVKEGKNILIDNQWLYIRWNLKILCKRYK